jgi:L-threonylcarbamoyladenylate synthase
LNISPLLTGGSKKVALRLTEHEEVVAICNKFGGAILSTSANKEGESTLLKAGDIKKVFPGVKVLQGNLGGFCKPSTIEDLMTGKVIRG